MTVQLVPSTLDRTTGALTYSCPVCSKLYSIYQGKDIKNAFRIQCQCVEKDCPATFMVRVDATPPAFPVKQPVTEQLTVPDKPATEIPLQVDISHPAQSEPVKTLLTDDEKKARQQAYSREYWSRPEVKERRKINTRARMEKEAIAQGKSIPKPRPRNLTPEQRAENRRQYQNEYKKLENVRSRRREQRRLKYREDHPLKVQASPIQPKPEPVKRIPLTEAERKSRQTERMRRYRERKRMEKVNPAQVAHQQETPITHSPTNHTITIPGAYPITITITIAAGLPTLS